MLNQNKFFQFFEEVCIDLLFKELYTSSLLLSAQEFVFLLHYSNHFQTILYSDAM